MTTPLTLTHPNLFTHAALMPALLCGFSATQAAQACAKESPWSLAFVINGLAAIALGALSICYALATSEVLVRTWGFASQAAIAPWAFGVVALVTVVRYIQDPQKLSNRFSLGSIGFITILTLIANGLD